MKEISRRRGNPEAIEATMPNRRDPSSPLPLD